MNALSTAVIIKKSISSVTSLHYSTS